MAITSIDFDKLVIDKIDLVTAFSKSDSSLLLMFDEIKNGTITNAGEKVYGTGAGGARLSALNRNKTAGFTCTNGFVVASAIAAQTGSDITVASAGSKIKTPTHEIFDIAAGATTITLAEIPVGTTGAEIKYIYKLQKDNTQGEKYSISATASATEFSLVPSTKVLTLPTGSFTAAGRLIVFYDYEASVGKKLINKGDVFAKDCKLVLDVLCRDVCDNATVYHTKFVFPSASIDNNFEIAVGDEPAVHNFGVEAMQNMCSADKEYWSWYLVE